MKYSRSPVNPNEKFWKEIHIQMFPRETTETSRSRQSQRKEADCLQRNNNQIDSYLICEREHGVIWLEEIKLHLKL